MNRNVTIFIFYIFTALAGRGLSAQEVLPFKVSRLSLNNPGFSEIAPVITRDGIMFCSDRRLSGVTDRTSFDNRRLYNVYLSERKDSADWQKPEMLKSERSAQFNTGPFCIAGDGKTLYFTSETETGVPSKNRKFRNRSGIFKAELSGMELISIEPFKYNNQDYDLGQPSVSPDGKYLFFASDMPGGNGRSDIYICESVNGEWSTPVNLGSNVNSQGTDNYPCMHSSGRLYFASDRSGGMGGLDVYYTSLTNGLWETPVRLSAPVNSSSDDFAFVILPDNQKGYFTSNRRRNDDIYEFVTTIKRIASCNPLEKNSYCYEFVEENAVKYDSIPFSYEWRFGDGQRSNGRMVEHCYSGPGTYLVQLDVTNLVTKEVTVNEKSEMLVVQDVEQPYISCRDSADVGSVLKLSADSTNLPGWDLMEYYWNFGDETIALGKNVEKSFHLPGNYNIQLIVSTKPGTDGIIKEACVSKNIFIIRKP